MFPKTKTAEVTPCSIAISRNSVHTRYIALLVLTFTATTHDSKHIVVNQPHSLCIPLERYKTRCFVQPTLKKILPNCHNINLFKPRVNGFLPHTPA